MSKLEHIESQVASLTADELARFREWFAEFDSQAWDRQIERDLAEGKLDEIYRRGGGGFEGGACSSAVNHLATASFWRAYDALPSTV